MLSDFWLWLEYLPVSGQIGATWWFPLMESLHVVSVTLMLGAILMLDLRILELAAMRYAVTQLIRELVPWSIGAFLSSSVTGIAMFITRASSHALNPAFQIKMILIFLAGINIAIFHFHVVHSVRHWNLGENSPIAAKAIATASLFLWCGVMLAGRWIGHIV